MPFEFTLEVLSARIHSRKRACPNLGYPCEADYLTLSERLDYYRLKEATETAFELGDLRKVGVYSADDLLEHQKIVNKLSQDLGVSIVDLAGFHLDVLRGMVSLRSGDWLKAILNERLLRQFQDIEVEDA